MVEVLFSAAYRTMSGKSSCLFCFSENLSAGHPPPHRGSSRDLFNIENLHFTRPRVVGGLMATCSVFVGEDPVATRWKRRRVDQR